MRQDAIRRSNEMYRKSSADYKKNSYIKLHESDNIIHDTTEKSQNEQKEKKFIAVLPRACFQKQTSPF